MSNTDDSGGGGTGAGGKRRQLGRGLSSLLGDDDEDIAQLDRSRQSRTIAIDQIEPGAAQPRRSFDDADLETLAQSIRERGVLQPILLRRLESDEERFEIIAGERRWRAAQQAQLHEIPALVREFDDAEALEIALIENIQRSDLTPLEEAEGYQRLIDGYGHTQEEIARAVGKSRSHIANTLRLLALPAGAREHLEAGRLSAGHARALLATPDADRLADYVVAGGLSVRATERLVQNQTGSPAREPKKTGTRSPRRGAEKDADTKALEKSLTEDLGFAVEITPQGEERGALTIHYQSLEQLDDVLARLSRSNQPMPPAEIQGDDPTGAELEESWDLDDDDPAVDEVLEGDGTGGGAGGGNDDDDPTGSPATIDFNALLAQTEALLTSGEIADGSNPAEDHADTGAPAPSSELESPAPSSALVGALLDALDAGGDPPKSAASSGASDQPVDQPVDDTADAVNEGPPEDPVIDDDEIAFIDDDDELFSPNR